MTFSAQVLANQATIISNQVEILKAIEAVSPEGNPAITAALAQMETQLTDIQAQVDVAQAAPATPPATGTTGATS